MSSAKKQKANRANAQASTGPKTRKGKIRAARNARRHGLSMSVVADPVMSARINALVKEIAGAAANSEVCELAWRVAEAQIDLIRIRQTRQDLLTKKFSDPEYGKEEVMYYNSKLLLKHVRHIDMLAPIPEWLEAMFRSLPQGAQKDTTVLLDVASEMTLMDRYERRALSRRKFAIRAFDQARRRNKV
jgi:phage anti-repressor protein